MGMCRKCSKVFSALEMRNGLCKGCMGEEELKAFEKGIPVVKEEKKKSSQIIDEKFLGIFVVLILIMNTIIYFFQEEYPDGSELFSQLFIYLFAGVIYTGFMALVGLIKKINTENKIWLISSAIVLIMITTIILLLIVGDGGLRDGDIEELGIIAILIAPFIVLPKLAFMIRGYLNRRALKKSESIKNNPLEIDKKSRIDEFVTKNKFNRREFFLGILLPIITIGSIFFYFMDDINEIFIMFFLLFSFFHLLFGLIRRGRDIGFPALRTIVLFFSLPILGIFLSDFDIIYDNSYLLWLLPLIFTLFFLLMPSSKKKEIIISKFEKIGLSLLLLSLFVLFVFILYDSL